MSIRVVHTISSECDIIVSRVSKTNVRIRITETDPDVPNPVDFEIEGNPEHIMEALATAADVLANIDMFSQQEPS